MLVVQWIEHLVAVQAVGGSIPLGHAFSGEGSHSGQLHEFRKLEGASPTQVRILYPPHASVVQRIERGIPDPLMRVRFPPGAPLKMAFSLVNQKLTGVRKFLGTQTIHLAF